MVTAISSVDFTGATTDNISWGDLTNLDGATQLSLAIWANFTTLPTVAMTGRYMLTKWTSFANFSYYLALDGPATGERYIELGVANGVNYLLTDNDTVVGSLFSTGEWVHLAATWNYNAGAPIVQIFLNGVLLTSATRLSFGSVTNLGNSSGSLKTGSIAAGPYNMNGALCYAHVYNRALTTAEINEIRLNPGSIKQNLVYYLPLIETDYIDLAGNAGVGTGTGVSNVLIGPKVGFFSCNN